MNEHIPGFFGLSGVHSDESPVAVKLGRFFEWPMILLAIGIILEWYIEAQGLVPITMSIYGDWFIWGFFVLETSLLLILVDNKKRYLFNNWGSLVIIFAGMPLLWDIFPYTGGLRALRLLILFSLLFSMSAAARKILSRNHLGTTLMVSFIIVIVSGTVVALIDPNIETPLDGIWWAWVTITTVGYGDIVPGSTAGRLFGSGLILLGIGLFSMLTASFSAFFLSQQDDKISHQELDNKLQLLRLQKKIESLEEKIDCLLDKK
ncbi:MAG: two pore domain potassium channel family protein [Oleispira antarctica]|mgnify:CR=1 FL=1|uniref:Kef-type K+ transport system, predicted NAD-binding component n=1 Tax=Oleispira antarctica RB-8 TaxID=698738 RepID=R4YQY0_OLEAN|nr:two pore domain potassium channel family protein [Oleispira antarctica]MBQ0792624.1 two pore domain potassium channel family protein [Oleispira antarctica]CCK77360.1 Kef-type K+ transport system, predicted NAD-binding component [Oleispira antarctica RB-8]|tara:strand:- start:6381 stop:7166 length:786 start_codon:yes stop_codon:yes gene_type:complete